MAIHEDVPGLEVTVRCHEQPLHELEDPNEHDNDDVAGCPTTTRYIECVDDNEFDISIKISSGYMWGYRDHVLVATTYVDGKYITGCVFRSRETSHGLDAQRHVKGQAARDRVSGLWHLRKFKFAPVKTVDDAQKERVEGDLEVARNLGTIEVKFKRAIDYGPCSARSRHDIKPGSFELAEKSLKGKAVSHGTSYGVPEFTTPPMWVDARDISEDNGPILVFRFMYRSREALRCELVIPRSPSRSPAFENLTPAERDRLARERLNELREKMIKQEGGNSLIKREFGEVFDLTQDPPAPQPTKKSRLASGREVDVIDLTDD